MSIVSPIPASISRGPNRLREETDSGPASLVRVLRATYHRLVGDGTAVNSTSQPTSEQDLLLPRVAAGDGDAVKACLDRFGGLVWSLCRRLTPTLSEAEDAAQEIFVEVWKSAGRYDATIASETAFVAMIARRRLIDRQRRAGRRPTEEALIEESRGARDGNEENLVTDETAVRAREAFEKLSEEQQRVLRLSIHHGLSHERISRATGLPLGTVKTHARRGLIKLRELMGATDGPNGHAASAGGGGAS